MFQREADAVRIKTKMIEDQTETIRKLKEVKTQHFNLIDKSYIMVNTI